MTESHSNSYGSFWLPFFIAHHRSAQSFAMPVPREQCAVLVPVAKTVEPETEAALHELRRRGYPVFLFIGSSQVDLARSTLASDAIHDGFEETFWIDSDVVFEPDDVDKLRSHDLPFVAGLYVKKGRSEFAGKFRHCDPVVFGVGGGLLEMVCVGFGFVKVATSIYRDIASRFEMHECTGGYDPQKRITPYFIPAMIQQGQEWRYLSEDCAFCFRAMVCGVKIMADTTIKLGHMSRKSLTWDDLINQPKYDSLTVRLA